MVNHERSDIYFTYYTCRFIILQNVVYRTEKLNNIKTKIEEIEQIFCKVQDEFQQDISFRLVTFF